MKYWWRLGGIGVLLILAGTAITAQTDRIFNSLTPTEGQTFSLPLEFGHTYSQTLKVPRTSLSKIGIWLAPLQKSIPNTQLTIAIKNEETTLRTVILPLTTLARDGATYANVTPPLSLPRGSAVQLALTIPPEANKMVAIQLRQPDDSFDASTIPFVVDGTPQAQPIALEAYAQYRPSFLIAIGIALIALALWWLTYPITLRYGWTIYVATLAVMAAIPGWLNQDLSLLLVAAIVVSSTGMIWLLCSLGLTPPAIAIGTNMWALTTWFPLQVLAQREYLLMWAALPYIVLAVYFWHRSQQALSRRSIILIMLWCLILLGFGQHIFQPLPSPATATVRDIFFDPYQITTAEKSIGAQVSWDNFGSYIGIIGPVLIVLGVLWQGKRQWRWLVTGVVFLTIALWPPAIQLFAWLPIAPQHVLIVVTLCLSYIAAWGMQGLHSYLRPSRLTTCLLWGIATLALLDLLYVWATVVEFTSL